jgi:hypothetical protein
MAQADSVHSTPPTNASKIQFAPTTGIVVKLSDYRQPAPKRKRRKSLYELYPLPFFDRKLRNCWAVKPSGDYGADIETGVELAKEFLASHDGTHGWHSLLQIIVMDMIREGPPAECWSNGKPHADGIVIGFMGIISNMVMVGLREFGPPPEAA